jgi:hypothetical protein
MLSLNFAGTRALKSKQKKQAKTPSFPKNSLVEFFESQIMVAYFPAFLKDLSKLAKVCKALRAMQWELFRASITFGHMQPGCIRHSFCNTKLGISYARLQKYEIFRLPKYGWTGNVDHIKGKDLAHLMKTEFRAETADEWRIVKTKSDIRRLKQKNARAARMLVKESERAQALDRVLMTHHSLDALTVRKAPTDIQALREKFAKAKTKRDIRQVARKIGFLYFLHNYTDYEAHLPKWTSQHRYYNMFSYEYNMTFHYKNPAVHPWPWQAGSPVTGVQFPVKYPYYHPF